jgi:hypothetical protein
MKHASDVKSPHTEVREPGVEHCGPLQRTTQTKETMMLRPLPTLACSEDTKRPYGQNGVARYSHPKPAARPKANMNTRSQTCSAATQMMVTQPVTANYFFGKEGVKSVDDSQYPAHQLRTTQSTHTILRGPLSPLLTRLFVQFTQIGRKREYCEKWVESWTGTPNQPGERRPSWAHELAPWGNIWLQGP